MPAFDLDAVVGDGLLSILCSPLRRLAALLGRFNVPEFAGDPGRRPSTPGKVATMPAPLCASIAIFREGWRCNVAGRVAAGGSRGE